jgi:predicted Rdx family selenoprotein
MREEKEHIKQYECNTCSYAYGTYLLDARIVGRCGDDMGMETLLDATRVLLQIRHDGTKVLESNGR